MVISIGKWLFRYFHSEMVIATGKWPFRLGKGYFHWEMVITTRGTVHNSGQEGRLGVSMLSELSSVSAAKQKRDTT